MGHDQKPGASKRSIRQSLRQVIEYVVCLSGKFRRSRREVDQQLDMGLGVSSPAICQQVDPVVLSSAGLRTDVQITPSAFSESIWSADNPSQSP